MTPGRGWRWLKPGEPIRDGDQFWGHFSKTWCHLPKGRGGVAIFVEQYRRRVRAKPSRKPGDVDKLLKQHAHLTHARAKAAHYR